jgi:hypothetical protein
MPAPPKRRARMSRPDLFPVVSEEYASAIGYVALLWSGVEGALVCLAENLLGIGGAAAQVVIAENNGVAQTNIISALLLLADDKSSKKAWDSLALRCADLRKKRNDIVHGDWVVCGGAHALQRSKARGALSVQTTIVDEQEVSEIADKISELADDIIGFGLECRRQRLSDPINSACPPGLHIPPPRNSLREQVPSPNPKPKRPPKPSSAQKRAATERPSSS